MEMKKVGLINSVLDTLMLDDGMAKNKFTPSGSSPLVKDADGTASCGSFSYSSMVVMLIYLSGHTRPNIAYAVNCCSRYMFCPNHSLENSLKRIGCYLKATQDRGLMLNPNSDVCKLGCYSYADFSGMYRHELPTYSACVKIRTGFFITFANCPAYWASKLHTETALSTI